MKELRIISIVLFSLVLLTRCNSNPTERIRLVDKELPIEIFVQSFMENHKDFNTNDITRERTNTEFRDAMLDTLEVFNILKGIPVKLQRINETQGRCVAQFQSWIKPDGFKYIRGLKVMLDSDLAELYEVEVKYLKRQVNRNIERFPKDFMFELTHEEYDSLRCQIGTLKSGRGQHSKYLPYVFTEEGVAMLSGVLRSKTAIQVNINIMRAFVLIRQTVAAWQSTNLKVEQLSHKVDQLNAYIEEILHDQNDVNEQQEVTNNEIAIQIEMINDALDQLRFKPQQSGPRIGYKK